MDASSHRPNSRPGFPPALMQERISHGATYTILPIFPARHSLTDEFNTQHLAASPSYFADTPLFVVLKNSQFEASRYLGRCLNGDLSAVH